MLQVPFTQSNITRKKKELEDKDEILMTETRYYKSKNDPYPDHRLIMLRYHYLNLSGDQAYTVSFKNGHLNLSFYYNGLSLLRGPNAVDELYMLKWFRYFASKKEANKVTSITVPSELPKEGRRELKVFLETDPDHILASNNKVTHLTVPSKLSKEGWQELEVFLQTDHLLQYIYGKDGEQIPFIKEKFANKFYDIIFYLASNRAKNTNGTLDLSHLYISFISTERITSLFQLINTKGITRLNLSYNSLQDGICKHHIAGFLNQSSMLKQLNLANNQITHLGLNYLLAALNKNQLLECLDLSNNYVQVEKITLKNDVEKFKKESNHANSFRFLVDISRNFLHEDCEEEFREVNADERNSEKKEREKDNSAQISYRQYGFFLTKSATIESVVDNKFKISGNEWLVALACKKDIEHAMIYMEGMRSSGQRFLERYHITAKGMVGIAQVLSDIVDITNFNREHYYFKTFRIDHVQGNTLKNSINIQKGKDIPFSKYFPGYYKKKVNCLKWAIQRLREIDIKVEESAVGLPSRTAGGSSCSIM